MNDSCLSSYRDSRLCGLAQTMAHLTIFQEIRKCMNHNRTPREAATTKDRVERHQEGLAGFLLGQFTELFAARTTSCRLTRTLNSSSFPSVHPLIHSKGLCSHSSDDQPSSTSCSHLTFVRLTVKCVWQQEPDSVRTLGCSMCNRVIKKQNISIIYSRPKLGTAQVSVYRQQQKATSQTVECSHHEILLSSKNP